MLILLLRSKKLKKPLEKFCRIFNSASWETDDCQSQPYPMKLFLWHLGKNLLMVFQPQCLRSDLPFAHDQKHWPSKPSNEWISPFQIVLSGLFSLFLWSLIMYIDLSPQIPMSVHTVEENYNLIPILDQISLKNGDSRGQPMVKVTTFTAAEKDFFQCYWPSL